MSKNIQMVTAGLIPLDANVTMRHIGADGKVKPIFQENALCIKLMKSGRLSPHWINQWYAFLILPFLGYWAMEKDGSNLITDAGRAAVASRINGSGAAAAFTSIGQGTGTTAASAADTALQTGVTAAGAADSGVHALATASVTVSRVTTTVTNDTAQLVGTVSESATIAITESGVFNADTAGTLLCRQVFTAVNVVNGDSLQFTWKIKAA
jgi:hypothetical protein